MRVKPSFSCVTVAFGEDRRGSTIFGGGLTGLLVAYVRAKMRVAELIVSRKRGRDDGTL